MPSSFLNHHTIRAVSPRALIEVTESAPVSLQTLWGRSSTSIHCQPLTLQQSPTLSLGRTNVRIPQRAESWTHGLLSLATAQAVRWPTVQPSQVPALICPLQRGTQHREPAGPGAGTVVHPWSEILGTQQGTRSEVAKNSPPPFLGVPVRAPVECRQKGTVQPGTLIDKAVWHPCHGMGSRESRLGSDATSTAH